MPDQQKIRVNWGAKGQIRRNLNTLVEGVGGVGSGRLGENNAFLRRVAKGPE